MPGNAERESVEGAPLSHEERHRAAVANTLSAARKAATRGDYGDALAWLATLDAVGHELSHEDRRLREEWRMAVAARGA